MKPLLVSRQFSQARQGWVDFVPAVTSTQSAPRPRQRASSLAPTSGRSPPVAPIFFQSRTPPLTSTPITCTRPLSYGTGTALQAQADDGHVFARASACRMPCIAIAPSRVPADSALRCRGSSRRVFWYVDDLCCEAYPAPAQVIRGRTLNARLPTYCDHQPEHFSRAALSGGFA